MTSDQIVKLEFPILNRLSVRGFKSIRDEAFIDIKPLTILAGANSSGKSSMMQPALLLKQTLEAQFDPGPLLLNGPNVKFTKAEQLLSKIGKSESVGFSVAFGLNDNKYELNFIKKPKGFFVNSCNAFDKNNKKSFSITPETTRGQIESQIPKSIKEIYSKRVEGNPVWSIERRRCFLEILLRDDKNDDNCIIGSPVSTFVGIILDGLIHLPGLRGNPERAYPVTAVENSFPGTFELYTASVIAQWQENGEPNRLKSISDDLSRLNLTWKVEAHRINDAQVELRVGRLPRRIKGGARDLVNITDVGFGVSQVLPVLVALQVASPGQIVYLEQPEIHLHPRAQIAMAEILANAAKRGVIVIIETHSKKLLLSIQALVAENHLPPDLVSLNWFQRDENGLTHVTQGRLDEYGRLGNWPEDFDDVNLDIESRYLNAIDKRMAS